MSTYLCFCLQKEQSGCLFPVQFCFLFPVQSCSQFTVTPANSKHKNLISGHSNWCDANEHPSRHTPKERGLSCSTKITNKETFGRHDAIRLSFSDNQPLVSTDEQNSKLSKIKYKAWEASVNLKPRILLRLFHLIN